jgi:hypothetical protein
MSSEPKTGMSLIHPKRDFWRTACHLGLIANSIGLLVWMALAASTWDLDHALGGLFPEFALMNLGLMLAPAFNICAFVLVCVYVVRSKKLLSLLYLLYLGVLVWTEFRAVRYDEYRFTIEQDAANEILLNETNGGNKKPPQ